MTEKLKTSTYLKTISLDFDGVLHSYTSPWTDAATISDGPTPGALPFLKSAVEDGRFRVVVHSSRCSKPEGVAAIKAWLQTNLEREYGYEDGGTIWCQIELVDQKPPAHVTLDDRAVTFLGTWPSLDRLAAFQPWNKKPKRLRADPETAVAAIDALMMRIGRIAKEVGCPDGVAALDWLEERARIGHQVANNAPVTIERLFDEDATTLVDLANAQGALRRIAQGNLGPLPWQAGYEKIRLVAQESLDAMATGDLRETMAETVRPTVDGVPVLSADELPVPERAARYAAARGRTVDEALADPSLAKPRLFHEFDEAGEPRQPGDDGKVEAVRQRQASLDAAFAPYAAVEAIIFSAVPAGTPITRACAGGDLGWRIGRGWMSVEGTDAGRPDLIRTEARALAAIPATKGEKSVAGESELVEKVLAAGRAL